MPYAHWSQCNTRPSNHMPAKSPGYDVGEQNRKTSATEVSRFRHGMEQHWFAYMSSDKERVTTWVGDALARITWLGAEYKCPAFGWPSTRQNFRARGIDGRDWYGTYYVSSGDYVRMHACKEGVTPK